MIEKLTNYMPYPGRITVMQDKINEIIDNINGPCVIEAENTCNVFKLKHITYKLYNCENIVYFQISDMDKKFLSKSFKSITGLEIESCVEPEITKEIIYLWGNCSYNLNGVKSSCENEKKAKKMIRKINASLYDWDLNYDWC